VLHRATGQIEHRVFLDLPEYLTSRDCLVVNRTRVLPAKFAAFRETGGRIGGLFIREEKPGEWVVLLAGAGRLRAGERLRLGVGKWSMAIMQRGERGECRVNVDPPDPAVEVLEATGDAPLPPYIRRSGNEPADSRRYDRRRYQTVYADAPGAIAAPTAGLHFTPALLDKIRRDVGAMMVDVVLHVGLGTFQPVEADDLAQHRMHREWYSLSPDSAAAMGRARAGGGRCVAVGTTSVRVLETCAAGGPLQPQSGWTDLCIYPPYSFRATDVLVTNFHLPGSTLLALVFAFAGRDAIMRAYEEAVQERYRFYSFGDAMLIL
jgi:S-adenosylmethionine:tRNA ribosyltransferase-isomerase